MVIDMHAYPGFIREISEDPDKVEFRREHFFLYKQHVWPLELVIKQLDAAGIDKAVLLPEDIRSRYGDTIVSNEEIKKLVDLVPDRFIGFASVDPNCDDAVDKLTDAFENMKLSGLNLNPSNQGFYPDDEKMDKIYEVCVKYNKPIMFHSGMTWLKNAPSKYSHPLNFEEVAIKYPNLRMCLAHFGWPWIMETAMLLLKYENIYADTSLLYFDSPKQFFETTFNNQLGPYWIDRMLAEKVMFGSNYPRIEQKRMKEALDVLHLREENKEKILGTNALRFLGW